MKLIPHFSHGKSGRPPQNQLPTQVHYQIDASLIPNQDAITLEERKAGRFILATNVLDKHQLSNDQLLIEYKAQQSTERGFRFLKDPLFFTSSVFLKSPKRSLETADNASRWRSPPGLAALAMVMGLSLLVYSLGQRALRLALATARQTIPNQLGKPTTSPTLRWVFQCFMSVRTPERADSLRLANCLRQLFPSVELNKSVTLPVNEVIFFSFLIPIVVNIICSPKFFCGMWGLSIALAIAQAHRGTIEVESQLNRGSTFTVLLPVL